MSKVQHPAFPEIVREVADVGEWVAAGWRPAEQAEQSVDAEDEHHQGEDGEGRRGLHGVAGDRGGDQLSQFKGHRDRHLQASEGASRWS